MNKIWEEVKENHKKLNGCALHEFEDTTPEKKFDKNINAKIATVN